MSQNVVSETRSTDTDYKQLSATNHLSQTKLTNKFIAWQRYTYSIIAAEISSISRYFDRVVQWQPLPHDSKYLLDTIKCSAKYICQNTNELPEEHGKYACNLILMNGNFNHEFDIQSLLQLLRVKLSRNSRIVAVAYNPYLRWLFKIANLLGLRQGEIPSTFLTETDVHNLAQLSGYAVTRLRRVAYCPMKLWGLGDLINSILPITPILKWFSFAEIIVLRPIIPETSKPSLSMIIPARNEKGNIENALKRLPKFQDVDIEIIFVEGHSQDGTWEEIQRVSQLYAKQFQIKTYQQAGVGKVDAVRLGFSEATKELLVILDADLSTPPELLERFYDAYCQGQGDFINGSRLLYPIEGKAMKFLNKLGNIFFAKILSKILGVRLSDTLCGTKLMSASSYQRFCAWRQYFGNFDPFGDFELLFPAAIMGLGIVDIPIHYRDRTYGATNIQRFRHGFMLLKMAIIGFFKITIGRTQ